MSPGLHRLQWLSIQKNGLHPSSSSTAGQALFMGISANPVHVLMFSEFTLVFTSCSVDQSSEQLREDPGFTLLHVCAAFLSGVNPFHPFKSVSRCFCRPVSDYLCVCEQDDHSEGAEQYCAAGHLLYICQRGQHGGKALWSSTLCHLQPCKLQSESCKNYSHAT